jgi:hypothetical protein
MAMDTKMAWLAFTIFRTKLRSAHTMTVMAPPTAQSHSPAMAESMMPWMTTVGSAVDVLVVVWAAIKLSMLNVPISLLLSYSRRSTTPCLNIEELGPPANLPKGRTY